MVIKVGSNSRSDNSHSYKNKQDKASFELPKLKEPAKDKDKIDIFLDNEFTINKIIKMQENYNLDNNINNKQIDDSNQDNSKKKKYSFIYILIILLAMGIFIISCYHIIMYSIEVPKTKQLIKKIENNTEVIEQNEDIGEIVETEEFPNTPYWNYIKMNLIDVDFTELKKINSDTISWLSIGGTNINYPVVQTTDNDYYLEHSFDKSKNSAGWLFMDYRNDKNTYGNNTIIYAHNRKDKTMFGTLKKLLTDEWYNVEENRIIKMSSEKYNTLWQIYSVYTINTTSDYIITDFKDENAYQEFINLVKNRSYRNFNTNVTTNDKTLTLSTCHGHDKKLVVHAKLIKIFAVY